MEVKGYKLRKVENKPNEENYQGKRMRVDEQEG
jgi:hypothetical protein